VSTFVLVSGAWHGPWAWDRVVPLLERVGARTIVPDLAYGRDVGLHDHVAQVVAALDGATVGAGVAATTAGTGPHSANDRLQSVNDRLHSSEDRLHSSDDRPYSSEDRPHGADDRLVLVGHSYAGLVVRQAADLRPELVDHVIMLEGWAGRDGDSMFSLAPEAFVEFIQSSADRGQVPAPAPALFGIMDPDDVRWLQERLRPQPLRTFTEGTRLTGAVDRIPGTGVYCRPQTFAFDEFAKAVGYRTIALDGPHDVMLADPEAVAGVLLTSTFRNRKREA
jgi:pimeloyl-ACP methyl ester carboxylesterase